MSDVKAIQRMCAEGEARRKKEWAEMSDFHKEVLRAAFEAAECTPLPEYMQKKPVKGYTEKKKEKELKEGWKGRTKYVSIREVKARKRKAEQ